MRRHITAYPRPSPQPVPAPELAPRKDRPATMATRLVHLHQTLSSTLGSHHPLLQYCQPLTLLSLGPKPDQCCIPRHPLWDLRHTETTLLLHRKTCSHGLAAADRSRPWAIALHTMRLRTKTMRRKRSGISLGDRRGSPRSTGLCRLHRGHSRLVQPPCPLDRPRVRQPGGL